MLRGYLEKELLLILWIQNRPVPLKDIIEIMQLVYTNQYSSYNSLKTTLIRTLNNLVRKNYVDYHKPYRRRYFITPAGVSYIKNTELFQSFLMYLKKERR